MCSIIGCEMSATTTSTVGRRSLSVALVLSFAFGSIMAAPPSLTELPPPALRGTASLEHLLLQRRPVRELSASSFSPAELGQLLRSAQGFSHPQGLRTAPSAGALYPLELYVVVGELQGLETGVYHFPSGEHALQRIGEVDRRRALAQAALGQTWVKDAAVVERTRRKYGSREERYNPMKVGHAGQNLFLQAGALGLGTKDGSVTKENDCDLSPTPFRRVYLSFNRF